MCRHFLYLFTNKKEIPGRFKELKDGLAAIQLHESKPLDSLVKDSLVNCDFQDNILSCIFYLTNSCLASQESRGWHYPPRVANRAAGGLADGLIDRSQVDDELSAPKSDEKSEVVEAAKLDFDRALSSNLHPHYHHDEDPECVMVAHICDCPQCHGIEDRHARKRIK